MNKRIQDFIVEYGERYNIPFSALEKFATDILSVRPTPKVPTDEKIDEMESREWNKFNVNPYHKAEVKPRQYARHVAKAVRDAMKKGEVR